MLIGVPKEIKPQEARVALVPHGVRLLVEQGHSVLVEREAGAGSGYLDADYAEAGAQLVSAEEAYGANLVLKVKEPIAQEYPYLRADQTLFTYLHLAANLPLTQALVQAGTTALAYEAVTHAGRLPLLEPMSEIAGRMSVTVGSYFLAKHRGGKGVLLGGVPGVLPGRVTILGGGTAGLNAARMALGLGAEVTLLDIDAERLRWLDLTLPGVHTYFSTEPHVRELLPETDLLIGAVLLPGARAPKLIKRTMLPLLKPGSVFVDIAIDQGGCAETSRVTTHEDPVYHEEGVLHYAVANMPGAYARTATQALTNVTWPYVQNLANLGTEKACVQSPGLTDGRVTSGGKILHRAVAEAHGFSTPT